LLSLSLQTQFMDHIWGFGNKSMKEIRPRGPLTSFKIHTSCWGSREGAGWSTRSTKKASPAGGGLREWPKSQVPVRGSPCSPTSPLNCHFLKSGCYSPHANINLLRYEGAVCQTPDPESSLLTLYA
jgi:hypothetical protein